MDIATDIALRDALEPLLGERLATALVRRLRPDPDASGDPCVATFTRRVRALARLLPALTAKPAHTLVVAVLLAATALALTAIVAVAATSVAGTAAVAIAGTAPERAHRRG
jgi:hypothetical protein